MSAIRLLLSFGATREPIDGVRFITNFSTGATGAELADYFQSKGHEVTVLIGEGAKPPGLPSELIEYSSFQDLDFKFKELLRARTYDAVIHLAAVSDYSVAEVIANGSSGPPNAETKLTSDSEITLRLKPNFKILSRLKQYGTSAGRAVPLVIGFKLTQTPNTAERASAVQKVFAGGGVDYVVHNDLNEMKQKQRVFSIFQASTGSHSLHELLRSNTVTDLGRELETLIQKGRVK